MQPIYTYASTLLFLIFLLPSLLPSSSSRHLSHSQDLPHCTLALDPNAKMRCFATHPEALEFIMKVPADTESIQGAEALRRGALLLPPVRAILYEHPNQTGASLTIYSCRRRS